MNPKKTTFFPQVHLQKHLLFIFKHLQEREAITLLTPLSSYPPKEARFPQQHTRKHLLGEQQLSPGGAPTHQYPLPT